MEACVSCCRHKLDVQFIILQDETLGGTYVDVLERRSNATHVLLAMDELLWLSHVDLISAVREAQLDCDSSQVRHRRVILPAIDVT